MPEIKLFAPTYYGDAGTRSAQPREEFDEPRVPVVVRDAEGVRIVLGSHDYWNVDFPDVQIERRARGWLIFLHPIGGSDPSGYVFMLDDGRSMLVPDSPPGGIPPIRLGTWDEAVSEVDEQPGIG